MAILIKNPETERKARELASLRGLSITAALDGALEKALAEAAPKRRKLSLAEMIAATDRLHEEAGIRGPLPPVTKAEWDELNEIPGFSEDDD
jgi:antitoxin VapB